MIDNVNQMSHYPDRREREYLISQLVDSCGSGITTDIARVVLENNAWNIYHAIEECNEISSEYRDMKHDIHKFARPAILNLSRKIVINPEKYDSGMPLKHCVEIDFGVGGSNHNMSYHEIMKQWRNMRWTEAAQIKHENEARGYHYN